MKGASPSPFLCNSPVQNPFKVVFLDMGPLSGYFNPLTRCHQPSHSCSRASIASARTINHKETHDPHGTNFTPQALDDDIGNHLASPQRLKPDLFPSHDLFSVSPFHSFHPIITILNYHTQRHHFVLPLALPIL